MTAKDLRPKTEDQKPIEWSRVRRVLVVKLRSIGDTVLATPSLVALKRFLPDAEIDILLEDWVAPLLEGFEGVNVIPVGKSNASRVRTALALRRRRYDVAFNLHGGTTSSFFVGASGAKHKVGVADHRYPVLYSHLLSSSADFWGREKTHSAEQQLAVLGSVGVPVQDRPRGYLPIDDQASAAVSAKLSGSGVEPGRFVLVHGATSFETKRWAPEKFASTIDQLASQGLSAVAVAGPGETSSLDELKALSEAPLTTFSGLALPEITALASQARIFVGIDSGMAHIAAAVNTPSVVIFGYSNRDHWRPWTDAPNEIVYEEFACQPCAGYRCEVYGEPRCIQSVRVEAVMKAINRLLG